MCIKSTLSGSAKPGPGLLSLLLVVSSWQFSCTKSVAIDPPTATITTAQVFADSADANSAIDGIYRTMCLGSNAITNGFASEICGMSADELLPFNSQGDRVSTNTLGAQDSPSGAWSIAYKIIYQVNASLEALAASKGIAHGVKNQLTGEAKFIRALHYFYLVNLFGDVPYLTSSDFKTNALAPRTQKATIYAAIIRDLTDAQALLLKDYSYTGGAKIRANSLAATALLARVYLYQQQWSQAEAQADSLISNPALSLAADPNQVFGVNSAEAILQWNQNTTVAGSENTTQEGTYFIPFTNTAQPNAYLRQELLNAFEPSDIRRQRWIGVDKYAGVTYYYPYKYKMGAKQRRPGVASTEFYTVLRLAEQYLIRAEARTQQNNLAGAIADINVIRTRAQLPGLPAGLPQDSVLAAVYQERRIEFFAEWGHRWLDLKRTGLADAVLGKLKPAWKSYQQLYPIPPDDRRLDPYLTQNPGYF
jgi:hypothetical protein